MLQALDIGCRYRNRRIGELMHASNLKHAEHFRLHYLNKGLEFRLIEMTTSDKPRSRLQKYRLTGLGKKVLETKNKS